MDVSKQHEMREELFPGLFIITGGQLYGNLGAAAMSVVTIENLRKRYPHAEIIFVSKYPRGDLAVLQKLFPRDNKINILPCKQVRATCFELPLMALSHYLSIRKLKPARTVIQQALQKVDVIIDIGGITFSEDRGITGFTINATWLLLGSINGKPIVKLSQAFGPFRTHWFKKISELLLKRIDLIISRGELSTKELKKLFLKSKPSECSDLAFLLKAKPATLPQKWLLDSNEFVFGIAPSSLLFKKMGEQKYIELMASIINDIVNNYKDSKIFLIAHSFRYENTLSNNDAPVCKWIQDKLSFQAKFRCHLIAGDFTPSEMRSIIGCTDIFLSCRFHAMVSALSAGIPVGVISWSHKYREVQHQFGIDLCIDQKDATPEKISCLIKKLVENRTYLQKQIMFHLPRVIGSAKKNFEVLSRFIQKKHDKNIFKRPYHTTIRKI